MNPFHQTKKCVLKILFIFTACILIVNPAHAVQPSKASDTSYVVEYSLLGLKDSAQQMADRNAWLVVQINQMKEQIPALDQRLSILDAQKDKLQLLSEDNFSTRTLKKYTGGDLNASTSLLKNQAGMINDQKMLEEKIRSEEIENQSLKENKAQLEDEVNKMQYELSLLNTEVKGTHDKNDWQKLIRYQEQSLKSLRNAQRTLSQYDGKYTPSEKQIKELEQEQKKLQEKVDQLENDLKISLNLENDIKQKILNIRGVHIQKITQLNQEIDQRKLKIKEMENTLTQAHTKIKDKNIQLNESGYSENDLKKNLDFMTQENLSLKKEMGSLKENLNKIETLR